MSTSPSRRNSGAAIRRKNSIKPNESTRAARAVLELKTLQQFRTIFASARRHDAEVRRVARISGSQLWALSEISRESGMRVNDLSERMALHQTTASNIVNALVEAKLARRVRDPKDQRVVRLRIAREGEQRLARAPNPAAGLLVDAIRQLSSFDLADLCGSLVQLKNSMRDAESEAAGESLLGE